MRKVPIESIRPGMRLAKTVFCPEGRIIFTSGMKLKRTYMERLKHTNIKELYIEDSVPDESQADDTVCNETKKEAYLLVRKMIENNVFSNSINLMKARKLIETIVDELLSNHDILANLSEMRKLDSYTFEHSVNVCVLSLITGIGLGYNLERLKDLGGGAILHDIGKLKIPEEILKKPSMLTEDEFEEIKKHTVYGYEILKKSKDVSPISTFIAFGHHERYNGSGYPMQIRGENIHQCARIVAIADVYDALTSDRIYRKKMRPHDVIEYITSLGTQYFDHEIVNSFIKYVAIYPKGTGVLLNSGERGMVVQVNKNMPLRPVVKILHAATNVRLHQPYEVDLCKNPSVFILDSFEM